MKYSTPIAFALSLASFATAAPVIEERNLQIGIITVAINDLKTAMSADQAAAQTLTTQMSSGITTTLTQITTTTTQMTTDIYTTTTTITASLTTAGTTLTAPSITLLTSDFQTAGAIAQSVITTYLAMTKVAATAMDAQVYAAAVVEILAAYGVLGPFLGPLVSYAKAVQGDGSANATAALTGLAAAAQQLLAILTGLNQITGVST